MVNKVVVLGGGSAGFLAAITLKIKLPDLAVTVIRSRDIGIIGVGEGSTVGLTRFLHGYLGIGFPKFFELARPTWKLGLKFLWGPRPHFHYSFVDTQLNEKVAPLRKSKGYYCDAEMDCADPVSALMAHDRIFERLPDGRPAMHLNLAYHFENERFVQFLEGLAAVVGVTVQEDTVRHVARASGPGAGDAVASDAGEPAGAAAGVSGLHLASGRVESADLYVDCSGFASALLGAALGEPFVSFRSSLFCDRAVIGGWDRQGSPDPADQVIKPYTTCETMQAGWCWQIEHETRINRGYVYCSSFVGDEEAEREFRAANPRVGPSRIVKFVSGRYKRSWVGNVVGIGNACGFVEPLEATSLGVIAVQASLLADSLVDSDRQPPPSHRALYNRQVGRFWDNIRDFLAVHYRFNTRIDSPFWRHCLRETDLAGAAEVVELYRENGPSPLWAPAVIDSANQFGLAGYYALLVGQRVPYRRTYTPGESELRAWEALRQQHRRRAQQGWTISEALAAVHSPGWRWPAPKRAIMGA